MFTEKMKAADNDVYLVVPPSAFVDTADTLRLLSMWARVATRAYTPIRLASRAIGAADTPSALAYFAALITARDDLNIIPLTSGIWDNKHNCVPQSPFSTTSLRKSYKPRLPVHIH